MNGSCKWMWLLLLVIAVALSAAAQETQRFETFGGYSLSHDGLFLPYGSNFNGWDTSTTVFLNRWLGFTSDFAGHYGGETLPLAIIPPYGAQGKVATNARSYTYLFGPHFTYRRSRYAPFAQVLFGIHNPRTTYTIVQEPTDPNVIGPPLGTSSTSSYNRFAMAVGGGLDIAFAHGISVRPVQAEYLLLHEPATAIVDGQFVPTGLNNNTFRYSAGMTIRFGGPVGKGK